MVGIVLELIKIISVLVLSFASVLFLIGGFKIIFADRALYKRNQKATKGFLNTIKGTVPTKRDGARTHNVVAGIAYNTKDKVIVQQGTLSNEAIESILR